MARKRTHKDVEFQVEVPAKGRMRAVDLGTYKDPGEAVQTAASASVSRGGEDVYVDVLVHSRTGARWYAASHGVDVYNEDPEASVHERLVINARSHGRIA